MKKRSLISQHIQACLKAMGQLYRSPLSLVFTCFVIGIALSLPVGLFVSLNNIKSVSSHWNNGQQITVYLKQDTTQSQINDLTQVIQSNHEVTQVKYISANEGMQSFLSNNHLSDIFKQLDTNPLPPVFVVTPVLNISTTALYDLFNHLKTLPNVDTAQLDFEWIKRLQAIIELAHKLIVLLFVIFSLAVLFILGNTIRLMTQNRQQEILIIKLIGGTNAFIRRPFLYSGVLHGFIGTLITLCLLTITEILLQQPATHLANLYNTQFEIIGLGVKHSIYLLIFGSTLGWLASWFSVNRYIRSIEPDM